MNMQFLTSSFKDFSEWGFGFQIDALRKDLDQELQHDVAWPSTSRLLQIAQIARKIFFIIGNLALGGLTCQLFFRVVPNRVVNFQAHMNRYFSNPLFIGIFIVSSVIFAIVKTRVLASTTSKLVDSMLESPQRLSGKLWDIFCQYNKQFNSIDLKDPDLTEKEFEELVQDCPHLTSITTSKASLKGLERIKSNCSQLRGLAINCADNFTDVDYKVFDGFTQLRYLKIQKAISLDSVGLPAIAKLASSTLNSLYLEGFLKPFHLNYFSNPHHRLTEMKIYSPFLKVEDFCIFAAKAHKYLETLGCSQEGNPAVLKKALEAHEKRDGYWTSSCNNKGYLFDFYERDDD